MLPPKTQLRGESRFDVHRFVQFTDFPYFHKIANDRVRLNTLQYLLCPDNNPRRDWQKQALGTHTLLRSKTKGIFGFVILIFHYFARPS